MTLLIYSESESARLHYIFDHIFDRILGLEIKITNDVEFFCKYEKPKINYSKEAFSDELFFKSSDILFEKDIRKQDVSISIYKDVEICFLCDKGALPFDPFAASFYMLTRYEEYIAHKKDQFGRFSVDESLAFQNNFILKPVVDHWILFIKELLMDNFPEIVLKTHKFSFINTIDVDNAYAYLGKGFLRTLGSLCKDCFKLDVKNICNKIEVFCFNKKDPYDTYDFLFKTHKKYNLKTIFFFLVSDYGFYDRNVNYLNQKFRKLIKRCSTHCSIGLHASVKSIDSPNHILIENKRLQSIINRDVFCNRQHFLNLNIPFNYRNLIKYGLKCDYSMGFPSHPGFRAGTSFNFYFFDLGINNTTKLLVYPFSVMDVSLKHYLKLQPDQALDLIKEIINNIKAVNGVFTSIWHNESLSCLNRWKDWAGVYEKMIKSTMDEKN